MYNPITVTSYNQQMTMDVLKQPYNDATSGYTFSVFCWF